MRLVPAGARCWSSHGALIQMRAVQWSSGSSQSFLLFADSFVFEMILKSVAFLALASFSVSSTQRLHRQILKNTTFQGLLSLICHLLVLGGTYGNLKIHVLLLFLHRSLLPCAVHKLHSTHLLRKYSIFVIFFLFRGQYHDLFIMLRSNPYLFLVWHSAPWNLNHS